jgi:hypothetical protein
MAVMTYRTRDGLADYGFSIDFQPGTGWRVYIVFQPIHDNHGEQIPYQAVDSNGRHYVDWSEKLDNLGDAKTVAAFWAELVQDYRRDQAQRARNTELIERYRRTREYRRATPADSDRFSDSAANTDGVAGSGHSDRNPVIPFPTRGASAESLTDLPQSV